MLHKSNVEYLHLALSSIDTVGLRSSSPYLERQAPSALYLRSIQFRLTELHDSLFIHVSHLWNRLLHYRNIFLVMTMQFKPQNLG